MDVNFVRIFFIFSGLYVAILGLLIEYMQPYLPKFLIRSFYYGKFNIGRHPIVSHIEVPKRWFRHFYATSAPVVSYVLYLVYLKYFWNFNIPEYIHWILDLCLGTSRQPLVSPESTFIALIVMTIQVWKRFYETHYVSIFSNSMINITHYLMGYLHYAGCALCLIGESKGFTRDSEATFTWGRITFLQLICALIALLASYEQLQTNYIYRNLRTNEHGAVVTTEHKIPHGRLFEYITGALQLPEIIIYISLSIILWESSTYHAIMLWVVINQVMSTFVAHSWYKRNYKNYPKTRKVIFPYVF